MVETPGLAGAFCAPSPRAVGERCNLSRRSESSTLTETAHQESIEVRRTRTLTGSVSSPLQLSHTTPVKTQEAGQRLGSRRTSLDSGRRGTTSPDSSPTTDSDTESGQPHVPQTFPSLRQATEGRPRGLTRSSPSSPGTGPVTAGQVRVGQSPVPTRNSRSSRVSESTSKDSPVRNATANSTTHPTHPDRPGVEGPLTGRPHKRSSPVDRYGCLWAGAEV